MGRSLFQIRRCTHSLVKTVSQPLSIKIDSLTKELHKLKSELALIEIENSKLIEKIEDNISEEENFQEKVEIFLESGMTANSIVNKINSTENLTGFIDFVPEEGSLATGKLFLNLGKQRKGFIKDYAFAKSKFGKGMADAI